MDKKQVADKRPGDQDDQVRIHHSGEDCTEVEDKYDSKGDKPRVPHGERIQRDYEDESRPERRFPQNIANLDSAENHVSCPTGVASYGDTGLKVQSPDEKSSNNDDERVTCEGYHSCDDSDEDEIVCIANRVYVSDSERELYTPCDDSAYGEDHPSADDENDIYSDSEREFYTANSESVYKGHPINTDDDDFRYDDSVCEVYTPHDQSVYGEDPTDIDEDNLNNGDSERELYTPYDEPVYSEDPANIDEGSFRSGDSERELYTPYDEPVYSEDPANIDEGSFRSGDSERELYTPYDEPVYSEDPANIDEDSFRSGDSERELYTSYDGSVFGEDHQDIFEREAVYSRSENESESLASFNEDESYGEVLEGGAATGLSNPFEDGRVNCDSTESVVGVASYDAGEVNYYECEAAHDDTNNGTPVITYYGDEEYLNIREVSASFRSGSSYGNDFEYGLGTPEALSNFDSSEDESYPMAGCVPREDEDNARENEIVDNIEDEANFPNDMNGRQNGEDEREREDGNSFVEVEANTSDTEGNHLSRRDEGEACDEASTDDEEIVKLTQRMSLEACSSADRKEEGRKEGSAETRGNGATFRETVLEEALMTLEKENKRYRESQMCKVCLIRELQIVFVPCGHLATCSFCSHHLYCCPLCRRGILNKVRVYRS